jgi:hypothetical protein
MKGKTKIGLFAAVLLAGVGLIALLKRK